MGVKPNANEGIPKVNRKLIALAIAVVVALSATAVAVATVQKSSGDTLDGAGSSFVYPLVSTWTPVYDAATGVHVNYNPIGSGGGIAAISNRSVDFGASDAPMTSDQFAGCHGCVQIPWALSATSVAYNLSGAVPHLRMNGAVLAKIFLGKITSWNDPAIKKLNPGKTLPSEKITPIFRSDSSGTTYNFTDYLSNVSPTFKSNVGKGTQVNFPVGVGGKGSSGVAAVLARTNGGITYVDVAYSLKSHFSFFAMQNQAGAFTLPGLRGIAGAAATVRKVPANNELSIVNPPKAYKQAYPICTFTYVILPLKTAKAPQLRKFVFWALTSGQEYGPKLLFSPVPKVVLVQSEKTLTKVKA
jgi:phosphate transport system substrate-binding protein